MESSDFDLLDRWGNGDHEAGRQLFEVHFEALHRFFHGKVADRIEELMEWTLLACVQGRVQAPREAGFRSYMFRLARFQVHAHYREHHKPLLDFTRVALADFGQTASHMTLRKDTDLEALLEALHRTPLDDHIALELSYREGLSGTELAIVFERSERAALALLDRATVLLRDKLQEVAQRPFGTSDFTRVLQQLSPSTQTPTRQHLDAR